MFKAGQDPTLESVEDLASIDLKAGERDLAGTSAYLRPTLHSSDIVVLLWSVDAPENPLGKTWSFNHGIQDIQQDPSQKDLRGA